MWQITGQTIKKQQELCHVHNILVNNKQVVDTKSIAAESHRFYTDLYDIQSASLRAADGGWAEEMREYIRDSALPALSP